MRERTSARRAVFSSAFTNGALRRIAVSYGCFIGAEWAVWLALLVFAYEHGGTSASALMALVQLVPSALLGPVLGALADHRRPGRVLVLGAAVQAASMAAVATAMALGAPTAVAFALAPATCVGVSMTRPAQAALLPSVVRSANELTASNVLTSWVEQAGKLAVPAPQRPASAQAPEPIAEPAKTVDSTSAPAKPRYCRDCGCLESEHVAGFCPA